MSGFDANEYERLKGRVEMARNDIAELADQVEAGEIDEATAATIGGGYERELAQAEEALAKLGKPPKKPGQKAAAQVTEPSVPAASRNNRILVGSAIMIVAFTAIIIAVAQSGEPTTQMSGATESAGAVADPCAEMVASLDNHPGNALRLAVADCYLQSGNAMESITHYRAVLENDPTEEEAAQSNVGLGFLNVQIGRSPEAAEYMRAALEVDPENLDAKYWLGMMSVYELNDPDTAIPLLEEVLQFPDLPQNVVDEIQQALAVARGGNE